MNFESATRKTCDLVIVGCGIRAVGTLTATPKLFDHQIVVIDDDKRFGGGKLKNYRIESNSLGTDFFGWVDPQGPFGETLHEQDIANFTGTADSFFVPEIGPILEKFGARIEQMLGPEHTFEGRTVERIKIDGSGSRVSFDLKLSGNARITSSHVALATGITEQLNPALQDWSDKVHLSKDIISAPPESILALLRGSSFPMIVIIGGGHSAFSVASRLQNALMSDHDLRVGAVNRPVTIFYRSPFRIYYKSVDDARARQDLRFFMAFQEERDVCPRTGNVFRYSGLRNRNARLCQAMCLNDVEGFQITKINNLDEIKKPLDEAVMIIQCMGYESRVPEIVGDAGPMNPFRPHRRVIETSPEGRLILHTPAGQRVESEIVALGLDPYPYKDNVDSPGSLYKLRGQTLLASLTSEHSLRFLFR